MKFLKHYIKRKLKTIFYLLITRLRKNHIITTKRTVINNDGHNILLLIRVQLKHSILKIDLVNLLLNQISTGLPYSMTIHRAIPSSITEK
jgi:hypothetical protein